MKERLASPTMLYGIFDYSARGSITNEPCRFLNHILIYTSKECPDIFELMKFYNSLHIEKVTNRHILTELSWIIYTSGFRFDVVKKYWPTIKEAFHYFDVTEVAFLSSELEAQAKRICRISGFRNLKKAIWCIQNAKRIIELDQEMKQLGGLKAYFVRISKKNLFELVKSVPNIVKELKFKGIGDTTIFHLMKNLGIDIFKPDIHVRRVLTNLQLVKHEKASTLEICKAMSFLSSMSGMKISELDTLLFVYGKTTHDGKYSSAKKSFY